MKVPTLLPRLYKIVHDVNERTYFVEWVDEKWVVRLSNTRKYLNKDYRWDDFTDAAVTATFDTPDAALSFWTEYVRRTQGATL